MRRGEPLSRRELRANAALTVVLACVSFWFLNALAGDHLRWRRDLSEDRLYDVAPTTRALLGELEDVLQVQAYFTGEARHGPVQIAKRRLVQQLNELEAIAGDRMRTSYLDPNSSTQARVGAIEAGIVPVPIQAVQGTSALTQEIYLGLVLRYRGRERAVPFALPQTFESVFVVELDRLMREEEVVVGFVAPDASLSTAPPALALETSAARGLVARDHEVRVVRGLAEGEPVPDDVGVLVVAGPAELHPRAAFEIDQFARRGGRVLVALDRVRVDGPRVTAVRTGLERTVTAWGAPLLEGHVWDHGSSNSLRTRTGGSLQYPYWVRVTEEGLDPDLPAVARLPGADLFWCHALGGGADAPEGVERVDLVRSTDRSWRVPPITDLSVDASDLEARAAELLARGNAAPQTLAVTLSGELDSAWDAAPAPRDPIEDALWAERVRAAREAGESPPPHPGGTTGEEVLRGPVAQVVIVGDADWMADGETFTERNRMLLSSLVDWLALDEAYRGLRTRRVHPRPIADFLAEERAALGVGVLEGSLDWQRAEEVSRLESEAQRRAERRRWVRMLAATGGSLGAFALAGLLARAALERGVPREGAA